MRKAGVIIAMIFILITASTSTQRNLSFVDTRYRRYVIEFIKEVESEGIEIPRQERWSIIEDQLLSPTSILGYAVGMNDDRQVNIRLHPILRFMNDNSVRYVIWHELGHDLYNIKHGECLMMKSTATRGDDILFPKAKIEFIEYLKNKNR